ncbi:hypothetical protein GCM10023142_30160 [Anaerocolumna aminovalerica]|uniref:hypothetical protein n=1 Tax=Anaerocolumna aminovalerica TaxID=1527 RepID=UPI001FA89E3E|nr:hypothetical protein [Anaerocolumna aminovalerica]
MADVLEVLYSICKARGYTIKELEAKRKKTDARGGFKRRYFWSMLMIILLLNPANYLISKH